MSNSKRSKTPFHIREQDRDYSGLSISDCFLEGANIEKSFFNGVNLTNCLFKSVKLNNCEFTEARIDNCHFENVDLSGSDFVDCRVVKTSFMKCNFEKGEWREATFQNCKFIGDNFSHTTITLCKFIECEFDEASIASIEHRAVYFNVFTNCRFARGIADDNFASRNFGTPLIIEAGTWDVAPNIGIESVCWNNNLNRLRVVTLAEVAESICTALGARGHGRTSTLTFFSKIVRVLSDERRISATSLVYLEGLITGFAASTSDQDIFMASMAAIIEIRSALFSISTELRSVDFGEKHMVRRVTLSFSETYAENQVQVLQSSLIKCGRLSPESLQIESIKYGSTYIELISTAIVSLGGLLTGLNYILRQAKITIKNISELKREIAKSRKPNVTKRKRALLPTSETRVQSIISTDVVAPDLIPVRSVVRENGRSLVELDEPAHVLVFIEDVPRRTNPRRRLTARAN